MNETIPFLSTSDYFDEVLIFLKRYQWIFNYPNTEILVRDVFEQMPEEWLNLEKNLTFNDLKDLVQCNTREDYPDSLKSFCDKVRYLSKSQSQYSSVDENYKLEKSCKLNAKKQHEIIFLAPLVSEICKLTDCNEVVDIGAGLGYLSYFLCEKYNLSICAIEGCTEKITSALKIQLKYHEATKKDVTFHHHFITANSSDTIQEILKSQLPSSQNLCVCGLHACADLSVVILNLFLKMKELKSMVIMPCCYHRFIIEKTTEDCEFFRSFPISKLLMTKFEENKAATFLRRPFLRLACQQTMSSFISMSEEEHRNHAKNFLMRTVLEKGAHEAECKLSRLKRKTGKILKDDCSFENYLENVSRTHKLTPTNLGDEINIEDMKFKSKLLELWEKHKQDIFLMELITALQTSLQSICENILLLDRLQFLRENGVNCHIRKVTDDNISPRCYALVAIKQ